MFILYPSGSHGNFLKLLLHELIGISAKGNDSVVYDNVKYSKPPTFFAVQKLPLDTDANSVINIRIKPESYLKYFAMCINRTAGQGIIPDDLVKNTFEQVNRHSILCGFVQSLQTISGKSHGDVEKKFLREWFRLCFFADNGASITKFIETSLCSNSKFVVDFESFYDGSIIDHCVKICAELDLPMSINSKISGYISEFKKNNLYFDIDLDIESILQSIKKQNVFDLSQTNVLQQAWIDNCLVNMYNIDPLLQNEYFANTMDLIEAYQLKKGIL
jgi:hypothetical protein